LPPDSLDRQHQQHKRKSPAEAGFLLENPIGWASLKR